MTTSDTARGTLRPDLERRLKTQLETWRRDLLTIDRRQKLVYFKHTKTGSLEIATPSPVATFAAASAPLRVASEMEKGVSANAAIVVGKNQAEVAASCRRLDLVSQQVYADRGFWTLYLGLGMLRWVDPSDQKVAEAPIVLCPVDLRRGGSQAPYTLIRNDDDVVVNPALRLHLEKTFSLKLPDLDLDDPDVDGVLAQLRRQVTTRPGWAVEDRTVLTTFSFHKEAIYRDLEEHESAVIAHPLVQLVALGADAPPRADRDAAGPVGERPIDDIVAPEDLVSILDADASQRACILAARDGRSFVMDGPPGTGKSQTIANMIAELITQGRRVLFVSEKAAALDVVRDRLAGKGLGDYLLELHSHAATRKEVVKQLDESLTSRATSRGAFTEADKLTLRRTRTELSEFAVAMNEHRTLLDTTVHSALGRLVSLQDVAHQPLGDLTRWGGLTADALDDLLEQAGRLSRAWRPVTEGDNFEWRDLARHQHTSAEIDDIRRTTRSLASAAQSLLDRCRAVDEDLLLGWPLDLSAASRRATLLELLEARPNVPLSWLTNPEHRVFRVRIEQLKSDIRAHDDAVAALASVVGAAGVSAIDPDACAAVDADLSPDLVWSPGPDTDSDRLAAAVEFLDLSPIRLAEAVEDVRRLGALMGIDTTRVSLRRATELGQLAALGGVAARPERQWLNPAVQAALDESMRVLSSVIEIVNERRGTMEQIFTPGALEIDLHSLDARFRERHTGLRGFSSAARADKRALKAITVSGRSDKTLRARLGEAAAWQKAEQTLAATEAQHAGRLGAYYEHTNTDFGRLAEAIGTARRAIELAGDDLNSGRLADQLGGDGDPDPRLTVIAERLLNATSSWLDTAAGHLGWERAIRIADLPLEMAASQCREASADLRPIEVAVRHVATVADRAVTLAEARNARARAIQLSYAQVAVFDPFTSDVELLGPHYQGLATSWEPLDDAVAWLDRFRAVLGGPAHDRQAQQMQRPVVLARELRERITGFVGARDAWTSFFSASRGSGLAADLDADLADAVDLATYMVDTCVSDVAEWDAFVTAASGLEVAGMGTTVEHLLQTAPEAESVVLAVEWAALQAWAESLIGSDPRLRHHRSVDRDTQVEKFRHLDHDLVARANIAVAAACSARRPSSMSGTSAQLIRREAQKKSRHLPIREILARTHEVVQELKPCFMMSPLAVSQFLPSDFTFDTVIFDEASQVLPSDAVNCIYRGAQLIVAGDEKQLPPTSFFAQTTSEDDVDEELDIFESVLNSCKSSMPSMPLTWHYRSQHESLITFSNYRFYSQDGGQLQTFPGATFESPDLGVASYVVNGVYRRGTHRDNPIEAEKVVDRVLFHRTHHPELSIGVVTFSTAQESAISAAIEKRALSEPVLAGLLDEHDRLTGFFVKNLENVQGDERDIIVFSIGYGPDDDGKFLMNFGPVTRSGGWRRLNVAVTRARRRVEVVTSFRAHDLREGANESLGHLKAYLDFAERGVAALGSEIELGRAQEGSVESDILDVLGRWGYDVDVRVGSAGYRLDLAVRHPDRPGEYALAIECDGPSYGTAASARDRDRLRSSVLAGLGWNLHRVWSIAWFRDRRAEIARLSAALGNVLTGQAPVIVPTSAEVVVETEDIDFSAPPTWASTYRAFDGRPLRIRGTLADVESRPALQDYLVKVLREEAPIHHDVVYRRVRDAFAVSRIGVNIRANIDFVAARIVVDGNAAKVDDLGFFRLGPSTVVRSPGVDEHVRTVSQTPPDEMDLAVRHVVQDAVSIEDDDLIAAVRQVFGWRRAGSDIQAAVLVAVDRLSSAGVLLRGTRGVLRMAPQA